MRYNGTFQYKEIQPAEKGTDGFYTPPAPPEWLEGGSCYIEKHIPAKQRMGVDGKMDSYTYEVFIPKPFCAVLGPNTPFRIICEDGSSDEFSLRGVNNLDRKSIIIWG